MECDIEDPEHLHPYFEEMTPIFKNTEVNLEDAGELMEKFAKDNNLGEAPRHRLIGSYFGEKICLATPLIQFKAVTSCSTHKIDQQETDG